MAVLPVDLVPSGLDLLRNFNGLTAAENIKAGSVRDDHPVLADADAANRGRADFARNFRNSPERWLVGAVVLRDVERMLLDEIQPLAQLEGRADRLAVVFGDTEKPVDTVVAFGIFDAAGADERSIDWLHCGKNLDSVYVKLAVLVRCAIGIDAQDEVAWNSGERRGQLRSVFDVAGGELRGGELEARGIDAATRAEKMDMQRTLRKHGVASTAGAHGVIGVGLDERRAERVVHRALRHQAARRRGTVADDGIRCAPHDEVFFVRAAGSEDRVGRPAQRIVRERGAGEATVEPEVRPIVHFVALTPPEETLRVVEDSGAIAELD